MSTTTHPIVTAVWCPECGDIHTLIPQQPTRKEGRKHS